MTKFSLAFIALAAVAFASPVPEADPEPQISLSPLIPSIPGVADPIVSGLSIPLPVLQLPTPPLKQPRIHIKRQSQAEEGWILLNWSWRQRACCLDDDTFGELIWLTEVPSSGNSPHHLGTSLDGKTLVGGGLLSLLKTQDTAYYFDVSNPYKPEFKKSNRGLLSSIVDEIRAKPDGGFFITYMGSAVGTSPGRLVETDANFDIIHQWPEDTAGLLNILGEQFNPHGLSVDWDKNVILTSDFVVPLSILKPSLGIVHANTLRLWNLQTRQIISTITLPNGGGIQDVKFIPGNPDSAAIATAVHLGQVWIIYPLKYNSDGTQGVAELLYDLGDKARDVIAIYTDLTQDGKFLYLTLTTANHIAALDISDLNNVKRLDDPDEVQPTVGLHYIKVTPDQEHIVVTDYFVQTGDIGLINTPADFKALYIDINKDGSLSFNRSIDFATSFPQYGGAKPHSSVVFDFTDPEKPIYY